MNTTAYRVASLFVGALAACVISMGAAVAQDEQQDVAHQTPQLDFDRLSEQLPQEVYQEATEIPEQPHFLRGFERREDEWEQRQEVSRFFRTDNVVGSSDAPVTIDKSEQGYTRPSGDTAIGDTLTISGKSIRVLYSAYHFSDERMYTFWSQEVGEKNLAEFSSKYRKFEIKWGVGDLTDAQWESVQRILGWAEFQAIHAFVKDMVREGLQKSVNDYQSMQLQSRVVEKRSQWLNDPAYAERLNESVPGTDELRVRDFLPVPCIEPRCFLPDMIMISNASFTGGFTNSLKVPGTESIVMLSMRGLSLQYISHWPLVAHEFVHTNAHLQGLPLSYYFDVEMWAALTTDLQGGGMREFVYHPYLSVIRDTVRTVFGYDTQEVAKRVSSSELPMLADIDESAFREHVEKVERIRTELEEFITDPQDGFMVRFYSDPYFWQTVNTKYCDTAAAWRVLLSLEYEPAGIYDPEKLDDSGAPIPPEVQTKRWLSRQISSGRLEQLAEDAMTKAGTPSKFAEEAEEMGRAEDVAGLTKCPVHSRFFAMSENERDMFKEHVRHLLERFRAGDAVARAQLYRIFAGSGALSVLEGIR